MRDTLHLLALQDAQRCAVLALVIGIGITIPRRCFAGPMTYRAIDLGHGSANAIDDGQPAGSKSIPGVLESHAGFWRRGSDGSFSFVDVLPTSGDSEAKGIRGQYVVGDLFPSAHFDTPFWSAGPGASHVLSEEIGDLNGVDQGRFVGFFTRPPGFNEVDDPKGDAHAILMSADGTKVDLHPAGHTSSIAYGISGHREVGVADDHAGFWSDTAASFVDVNPTGFVSSVAHTVAGGRAAGEAGQRTGGPGGLGHAILWNGGDAGSAVDLNPAGFDSSAAYGINGAGQVVGGGENTGPDAFGREDALLWPNGSPDDVIDLSEFLPPSFRGGFAHANAIDEHGNIAGVANGPDFELHAIVWVPVSSSISLPAGAVPGLAMLGIVSGARTVLRRLEPKRAP